MPKSCATGSECYAYEEQAFDLLRVASCSDADVRLREHSFTTLKVARRTDWINRQREMVTRLDATTPPSPAPTQNEHPRLMPVVRVSADFVGPERSLNVCEQ